MMNNESEQQLKERISQLERENQELRQSLAECKQAEDNLRESEERFRNMFDTAPVGMVLVEMDGTFVRVNPEYCEIVGYSRESLEGKMRYQDVSSPDSNIKDFLFFQRFIKEGGTQILEKEYIRKDGEHVFVRVRRGMIADEQGKKRIWAYVENITEQKQAQDELLARLRYEEQLAFCSQSLLTHSKPEQALPEAMKHLLSASGATQVCFFENFEDPAEGLCMRQVCKVLDSAIHPKTDSPVMQHIPYNDHFSRWINILSHRQPIMGDAASFPKQEREFFEHRNIFSILVLPVFLNQKWHGLICFDDTQKPRKWNDKDIAMLRTGTEMIGSYLCRKIAEEKLKTSETILKETQRLAKLGGWEFHLENNKLIWTDEVYRIYELESDYHPTLEKVIRFYAPDDIPIIEQAVRELIKNGTPYDLELQFVTAKGNHLWIRTVGKADEKNGKIIRLSGTFQDITKRKIAENRLRETLNEMEAIFDNTFIGIAYTRNREIVKMNQRGAEIFGYTPDELIGKSASVIQFSDEEFERFGKIYLASLFEKGCFEAEHFFRHKDGTGRWCRLYAKAMDPGDFSKGVIWALDDITIRKQMKLALQQAKDAAESANQAKGEFLANMSHEIRTPMNGIIGMTRLLLDTALNTEQLEYAEVINYSSEALLSLVNDILDFSKIEAGKLELEMLDFHLLPMIEEVVSIFFVKAKENEIELEYRIDPDVPDVLRGDPARIRQILLNLVGNAIKFTKKGKVGIHVSVDEEQDTHIIIRFSVTDTGIGISENHMDRLFKFFSQADASTTRQYGGTGLGLAISKKLSELMGGESGFESREGVGSTFWFTVFCKKEEVAMQAEKELSEDNNCLESLVSSIPASCRILLAEDNVMNQKVALAILKSSGFSADIAENGNEVMEMLEKKSYDLILMDVQMPDMDGVETTKKIRSSEADFQNVPIIAMTAHAMKGDRERYIEAGMDDYISKPIQSAKFLALIREHLSGKQAPFAPENKVETRKKEISHDIESSSSPVAIFDEKDFLERMGGNKEFGRDILKQFPEYISEQMKILKEALDKEDIKMTTIQAHGVKGMVSNISAGQVRDIAYEIELASKKGDMNLARSLMKKLEQALELLLPKLNI